MSDFSLGSLIDSLYGEGSDPWTLTGEQNHSRLVRLRSYVDRPTALGEYWVPGFCFAPWMAAQEEKASVAVQHLAQLHAQGFPAVARTAALCADPGDIFVIEQDRLILPSAKGECTRMAEDGIREDELITLQPQVIWQSWQAAGLPCTAAVASGSKSVHFYIRMADPEHWPERPPSTGETKGLPESFAQVLKERNKRKMATERVGGYNRWYYFQALLALAIGPYDASVLQSAGQCGYVRTPGAIRSTNGRMQEILHVGAPVRWADMERALLAQLSPEAIAWLHDQHRVWKPLQRNTELRVFLRHDERGGWKDMLVRRPVQGQANGMDDQALTKHWKACMSELYPTQRQPEICRRPSVEAGDWGDIRASYLWWVTALTINYLTAPMAAQHPQAPVPYGWVFTGNDWWWEDAKGRENRIREIWSPGNEGDFLYRVQQAEEQSLVLYWESVQSETDTLLQQWRLSGYDPGQAPVFGLGEQKAPLAAPSSTPQGIAPAASFSGRREAFLAALGTQVRYATSTAVPFPDQWMAYNGFVWQPLTTAAVKHAAQQAFWEFPQLDAKGIPRDAGPEDRAILIDNTIAENPNGLHMSDPWEENPDALVCANGTVRFDANTVWFEPDVYESKDMITKRLPFCYDPTCATPLFDAYMESSFVNPVERAVMLQFFGYLLYPRNPFKVIALIQGATDTGKTTMHEFLTAFVGGPQFVMTPSITSIAKDNYWASGLPHARLISIDEQTDTPMNFGKDIGSTLKKLSGDGTIEVRQMRVDPFNMLVRAKLLITTNNMPNFSDDSSALWKRFLFFETSPPKKIVHNLAQRIITQEMPGVFAKCVAALQQLLKQGGFTKAPSMLARVEEFREVNSPLMEFFSEWMEPAPGLCCYLPAVAQIYKRVRDSTGFKSMNRFVSALRTSFPELKISRVKRENMPIRRLVAHIPPDKHLPQSFYLLSDFRCRHPASDDCIAPPVVAMEDRGTINDPTVIPMPRYTPQGSGA
jgi:hypothetical protein